MNNIYDTIYILSQPLHNYYPKTVILNCIILDELNFKYIKNSNNNIFFQVNQTNTAVQCPQGNTR